MSDKVCENMLCDELLTGRQQRFCSDKCRKQVERGQEPADNPDKPNSDMVTRTASYQDYIDHPEDYAHRAKPQEIDWESREPIPGDYDYDGVCEKIDGVWRVKAQTETTQAKKIRQPRLSDLPPGVTHPQGQRNAKTRDMKQADLARRIHGHGASWMQSPEYAEQIYRLQTLSLEELEESGQHVPMWRKALG